MEEDIFELAQDISNKILESREKIGVTRLDIARHLCKRWNSSVPNAMNYIRDLERNFFGRFGDENKYDNLGIHEKRISDYLFSLGITEDEAMAIVDEIKKIRPGFKIVYSDVKPYR